MIQACVSIGIKIKLTYLLSQLEESNFELVIKMLSNGFIEQEKYKNFNHLLLKIWENDKLSENYKYNEAKTFLTDHFTKHSLLDKYLLLPIKPILHSSRSPSYYDTLTGSSRALDFDLSVELEKYKEIRQYELVFIQSLYCDFY